MLKQRDENHVPIQPHRIMILRRHGNVSGIIIPPHFRQSTAVLRCEKIILRWPGPFGSGFLSPQPPGAVGIGPVSQESLSPHWANESWSFFFLGVTFPRSLSFRGARETNEPGIQKLSERDSGFALRAPRNDGGKNFSVASCRRRPALGRASRDCRPGHRPQRRRRRHARCFPAVRSSCRDCRSSPPA
jgi:hypothetical protein